MLSFANDCSKAVESCVLLTYATFIHWPINKKTVSSLLLVLGVHAELCVSTNIFSSTDNYIDIVGSQANYVKV